MSSTTAQTDNPATHATQRAEDAQYHRAMLHELAEMGMGIARVLHRHATAEPAAPEGQPTAPAPESAPQSAPERTPERAIAASAAFERIARTVGRTIALAHKLSEPDRAPAPEQRAAQGRRHSAQHAGLRRIDPANPYAHLTDAELDELAGCLNDGPGPNLDLDDDLGDMPFADAIAMVCRDLGTAHVPGAQPRTCRTLQDVRDLCALVARLPEANADASASEIPGTDSTGQPKIAQPGAQPAARPFSPSPQSIHDGIRTGTGPPAP